MQHRAILPASSSEACAISCAMLKRGDRRQLRQSQSRGFGPAREKEICCDLRNLVAIEPATQQLKIENGGD
jgi:hypothetical protein